MGLPAPSVSGAGMSRQQRADIARQTDQIVADGRYTNRSGVEISIAEAVAGAVRGTVQYLPEQVVEGGPPPNGRTLVEVTEESTLAAARRLVAAAPDPVACLNFASARKPGGGYRSGAAA